MCTETLPSIKCAPDSSRNSAPPMVSDADECPETIPQSAPKVATLSPEARSILAQFAVFTGPFGVRSAVAKALADAIREALNLLP